MSKNGNITSFFKPVAKISSSQQSGSASQLRSPHRQEPSIPSSPSRKTPPPPSSPLGLAPSSPLVPAARDPNAVIRGSDDEDDTDFLSSDDDLPSLFTRTKAAAGGIPVPASRKDLKPGATPRAKRTALEFPVSPLTIQPKHKFDFKALMKHALADDALLDSEQRMEIAMANESPTSAIRSKLSDSIDALGSKESASLHETMLDVFSDAENSQDEGNREKLIRAVKRSQATPNRKEYHFFDDPPQQDSNSSSIGVRSPFPKAAAKGPWKFLAKDQGRTDLFEDGVPFLVQSKLKNLPDEIFTWVLGEIPFVKSARLREEYLRLLEECPGQAGRLIDENLVVSFFRAIGASERALDLKSCSPHPSKSDGKHYSGTPGSHDDGRRDWTGLLAVLEILSRTSEGLRLPSLTCSIALLIRLGMDRVIREDPDVELEYQETFWWLIKSIPRGCWDKLVCFITSPHLRDESYPLDGPPSDTSPLLCCSVST